MNRVFARTVLVLVSVPAVLVASLGAWWRLAYVDENLENGERWGVSIGRSEIETLRDIKSAVPSDAIVLGKRTGEHESHLMGHISEIDDLHGFESLVVMWEGFAVSDLSLHFEQGRLLRASMHRRAFELP